MQNRTYTTITKPAGGATVSVGRDALSRLRRSAAGDAWALTALAVLTGVGAGVGAIAFRYLIEAFTYLFSGHLEYGSHGRVGNPLWGVGPWFLFVTPVLAGIVYGPLVARFAPEARGHGVPEVMEAVSRRGGRMRPQVPIVKSLASALCIGSGGSVGREGPIVQIGSALGSLTGQLFRLSESHLRLLVACGAAGGISATFNAPIAGVFFALELILRNFGTRSFGLVVVSSVTADAIGRAAFGSAPFLKLPAFGLDSPVELLLYAGLGALATVVGMSFIRVLYGGEDLADRLWPGPEWLRPAVGGILLGALLFAVPQMYGVGYGVLAQAVSGKFIVVALLGLLLAKILATSLTMWIGGSGGVFAPSLFMGGMLGSAYGAIAHTLMPGLVGAPGAYGIVGMGAVFAATSRAPITAVIIIFELTDDTRIILPLMLAVVVATALSNAVSRETIYTLKLLRRGVDINAPATPVAGTTIAQAMGPLPQPVDPDDSFASLVKRFANDRVETLPVVAHDQTLLGVVAAADVEQVVDDEPAPSSARALLHTTPELRAGQPLRDAIRVFASTDDTGLPVLGDGDDVVGWITHLRVLRAADELLDG